MADPYVVRPDSGFTKALMALGGNTLNQCYQCATCSVTCTISPDDRPFPRKEMIWAQWGLKDKLLSDPDIWLCHRCSDCTVHCPRGAAPGDVLAAARDYSIQHYAIPGFMGKAAARAKALPMLLLVPAVLIAMVIGVFGELDLGAAHVNYEHFFPHLPLQVFFGVLFVLALVFAWVSSTRIWKDMNRISPGTPSGSIFGSFLAVVKDILTHSHFKHCEESRGRFLSHTLTFYGFLGLFITTCGVVVSYYGFHYYPLALFHPLKVLGNVSTIALAAGLILIVGDRNAKAGTSETSTSRDWNFIVILAAVTVTGLVTEVLRFANIAAIAYPVYYVHLVFVFALLIYLPYSRFAHLVYRTVALVHAKYTGRDLARG